MLEECGYVADLFAFDGGFDGQDGADEQRGAAGLAGPGADGFEGMGGLLEEGTLFEEIGGPVAADGELGEEDEVGLPVGGTVGVVEDFAGIAGEVAYGRVDLGKGDLHWISLSMMGGGWTRLVPMVERTGKSKNNFGSPRLTKENRAHGMLHALGAPGETQVLRLHLAQKARQIPLRMTMIVLERWVDTPQEPVPEKTTATVRMRILRSSRKVQFST